jgi:hypothetical protein
MSHDNKSSSEGPITSREPETGGINTTGGKAELKRVLAQAVKETEKSYTKLATEMGMPGNHFFISRLLSTGIPPRTRIGRNTARQDDRYTQLATVLGLELDPFLQLVENIQVGATEQQKKGLEGTLKSQITVLRERIVLLICGRSAKIKKVAEINSRFNKILQSHRPTIEHIAQIKTWLEGLEQKVNTKAALEILGELDDIRKRITKETKS